MKKLSIVVLILGFMAIAHNHAFAQKGNVELGGGLMYGTEVEAIGIQGDALIGITDKIDISPDITIFFTDEDDTGLDSWWEINGNVHYNVLSTANLSKVYGLAGLNITTVNIAVIDDSESEAGLNLGAGVQFNVPFGSIFGELRYVFSDLDQLVLGGGVRVGIN